MKMILLLFSLPVHPTHPKIEEREQLCMLRQSLTRTNLRASSPHAPFGEYRSWIVTREGPAKGDERAKGIFSRLASLVIQIGELWSPVPSPYQPFSPPYPSPNPRLILTSQSVQNVGLVNRPVPGFQIWRTAQGKSSIWSSSSPMNSWNRLCSSVSNKANRSYVMPFLSAPE